MQSDKLLRTLVRFWGQVGYALIFVCALDLVAALFFWAFSPSDVNELQFADGYRGAHWTAEYYREHDSLLVAWHPYVDWLALPYHGEYLQVGKDGLRATWPGRASKGRCAKPVRIFLFGGSTMFGYGVRDHYTIPSWLQRLLDNTADCTAVYNYGQDGYVSTQEVLFLQEQLRQGNVPDLVIFYDGLNDSYCAAQNGEAGTTFDEEHRRKSFMIVNWLHGENRKRLYETATFSLMTHSALGEVAKRGASWLAPGSYKEVKGELVNLRFATDLKAASCPPGMPAEIVQVYLGNRAIAAALAAKFGFQLLVYWQPSVFQKSHLTPWERKQAESPPPGIRGCAEAASRQMSQLAAPNGVIDLSGLFRQRTQPFFVDDVHLTEDGNRIVAERMMRDVLPLLEKEPSKSSAHPPRAAEGDDDLTGHGQL